MHAAGHQVVHQVVTAGDGIEYVGDPAGLFLLGDGFVAEMGFVVAHALMVTAAAADCGARGGVDIAGQALFLDLLQVFLPQFVVVLAQVVEHVPGVEAAVVAIRENQAQRIGADRLDAFDIDIALAGLQGFLTRAVTTGFSRRRVTRRYSKSRE
jgi:hypothetical protein